MAGTIYKETGCLYKLTKIFEKGTGAADAYKATLSLKKKI